MDTTVAKQVTAFLLEAGAVRLNPQQPFTWSSGWKSPIYCDNRITLSYPRIRSYIKNALYELIQESFPGTELIAGVATAGIPQGVLVADLLALPFVYVRSKPKEHGMGNLVEGRLEPGQKTVVIEDLISTGGSSLKVAAALREAGAKVTGMVAIFTYGFPQAERHFQEAGIPLATLTNYNILIDQALQSGHIGAEVLPSLKAWRQDPENWNG
jgi:orotate phosphoribosyltransferase